MKQEKIFDLDCLRLQLWQKIQSLAHNIDSINENLSALDSLLSDISKIEIYWAFPGKEVLFKIHEYFFNQDYYSFKMLSEHVLEALHNNTYKKQEFIPFYSNLNNLDKPQINRLASRFSNNKRNKKLKVYFEVLIIHPNLIDYELLYRNSLAACKSIDSSFLYDFIMVDNAQDALIAILSNTNIQACVYLSDFKQKADNQCFHTQEFNGFCTTLAEDKSLCDNILEFQLKEKIQTIRPELEHYFISEIPVSEDHYIIFDRIIMGYNLFADLHQNIISGIEQRYSTPFFDALRNYASKPKGAFHALPISQGQSISHSPWISDVIDFYGDAVFAAETSSTLGGMDSLMDPKGSISQAQNQASNAFNSVNTYFVTNGTTTANKIIMQANLQPDDIVLVSSDCHKSIPYSVFLSGATAIFLETYPLNQYDLYGCVTLERIKEVLLDLRAQNQLHRVKQITLTNSTFDGVIYDVKRFMLDILAIKADIIFHWDEAWFSFASFNPLYHNKTAMGAANDLSALLKDENYCKFYQQWSSEALLDDDDYIINHPLYPDPEQFKVRVYASQSIHKTLTAFRQASMLHIHDIYLDRDNFHESYRTHTSTSPNYQLIASLDFARRQMVLEGYELVKKSICLAFYLRRKISECPLLSQFYTVLGDTELIPEQYRGHSIHKESYEYLQVCSQFKEAVFSVDPTRVTLDIHNTGIDGPNFRQLLMTQYDIQVNKTSRNTILLIINIGVNKDNIEYLLEAFSQIATKLLHSTTEIFSVDKHIINLPQTRLYHNKFVSVNSLKKNNFQAINIRKAYYAGMLAENIDFVLLSNQLMSEIINDLRLVSASFVTPYPPGFPIIVPGQLINYDLLLYLQNIQIKEIHGYHPEKGLKIFTESYLSDQ